MMRAYLALGVLAAFLALAATALWYRSEAIDAAAQAARARADLGTAVAANQAQEATIGRLRADAARNDRILAQLAGHVAEINTAMTVTNQAVGDLRDASEDVRAYLAGLVPADLDRLLNR